MISKYNKNHLTRKNICVISQPSMIVNQQLLLFQVNYVGYDFGNVFINRRAYSVTCLFFRLTYR